MTETVFTITNGDAPLGEAGRMKPLEEGHKDNFDIVLASAYLDDALRNRNIPFRAEARYISYYNLYKSSLLVFFLYVAYLTNVSLALFEKPAVFSLELPLWATLTIEVACLSYFIARLIHERTFSENSMFWRDTKHITYTAMLVLIFIDIILYLVVPGNFVRWSRPLRPFLIINFPESREVRRAFRNIRNTLPDILTVLVLLLASVALFSLVALKLFEEKNLKKLDQSSYFTSFPEAFWDLYILVTSSNSPDIMMPAYADNKWYTIFFITFVIINLYTVMGVFLAVVYNSYKNNLRNETRESVEQKRKLLTLAFDSMKADIDGQSVITKVPFMMLMKEVFPKEDDDYFELVWLVLDPLSTGRIALEDFMHIYELTHLKVANLDDEHIRFEIWCPNCYNSGLSKYLIRCIKHKYFRYFFDLAIVVNAILIGKNIEDLEWIFLFFFAVEIVAKLFAFGFKSFFKKLWNIFDLLVVGSAIITSIVGLAISSEKRMVSEGVLDFLMVLRVLRIFKIFHGITRFRIVINTILHILPSFITYGCLLLLVFYFFAIIGMEFFGGKILPTDGSLFCGNPKLNGSEFASLNYCLNNFNDILSSFITLFELMTVNQWHVITHGHVLVTNKGARCFFFAFHCVCVIIIMNIFLSFVIEAFVLEFYTAVMKPCSKLHNRIYMMGLAFGYYKSETPLIFKTEDKDIQHLISKGNEKDQLDSDHNTILVEGVELTGQEPMSRSVSHMTKLRFHLTKRNRTLFNIMERMFENENSESKA